MRVLEPFRPCFTAPTFATFVTLVAGMVARPAHLIVGQLLPIGAPLLVAVDDTMFRRAGRKVHAAQYPPEVPDQPTHEEIHTVQLAWAQAAA
jgi:hypothetical protein